MIRCTRLIEFDAAHRVVGHKSKCQYLHGHRYKVEVTFAAEVINDMGMVIDFGIIKEFLGKWIDDNWDHTTILFKEDFKLGQNIAEVTEQKIYYLPYNPTAENMATYLFEKVCPDLFYNHKVSCTKVRVYETPNCYAEVF